jgi:hypothetical protein
MLRYPTMVASTSAVTVLTAATGEEWDLRDLCVPVTFTSSRFVFGQEHWRTA